MIQQQIIKETVQMNFHCPRYLKQEFDHLATFRRQSMASVLRGLMEQYVRDESTRLRDDMFRRRVMKGLAGYDLDD